MHMKCAKGLAGEGPRTHRFNGCHGFLHIPFMVHFIEFGLALLPHVLRHIGFMAAAFLMALDALRGHREGTKAAVLRGTKPPTPQREPSLTCASP